MISCLMITTNKPDRLDLLDRAIEYIYKTGYQFDQKILSVDVSSKYEYPISQLEKYARIGWEIDVHAANGMANNILKGLCLVKGDLLFYCEDHIFIEKFPSKKALEKMFVSLEVAGACDLDPVGYICYNTHIIEENLIGVDESVHPLPKDTDGVRYKYMNDPNHYRIEDGEVFLVKHHSIRDEYYLNFPAAFVRTDLFEKMMLHCVQNLKGMAVETGVARAWHDLEFNHWYDVLIYLKPEVLNNLPLTFTQYHQYANMKFRNNCPELWELKKQVTCDTKSKLL